jgi:hypothetical protein
MWKKLHKASVNKLSSQENKKNKTVAIASNKKQSDFIN